MRVQITATFDDLVDVTVRAVKRGQQGRDRRWQTLVAMAVGGVVVFFLATGNLEFAAFGGVSIPAILAILLFWPYESRLRNWLTPIMGTAPRANPRGAKPGV